MRTPEMLPRNAEAQLSVDLSSETGRRITIIERVHGGIVSETYSADCDGAKVFVKINTRKDLFPMQAVLADALRKQGVPVPEVLACVDVSKFSKSVLIEAAVSGEPLDALSMEKRTAFFRDTGQLLRTIHSIKVEGFGPLMFDDGALRGTHASWKDYVQSSEDDDYSHLVTHGFIAAEARERIVSTIAELSDVPLEEGSVIHGDIQAAHVFSDGTKVTGLIDFGNAKSGDPRLDLAIARVFLDDVEWASLKEGYGALANDGLVKKYVIAAAARKLMRRHQAGRSADGIAKALKVLNEALQE